MWLGGVPVFGGVIIWLAAAGPYNQGMLGIPRSVWLGVGLALAAWGLLFSYAMYRCPHCRRPITSAGVQSGVAFDFNANWFRPDPVTDRIKQAKPPYRVFDLGAYG